MINRLIDRVKHLIKTSDLLKDLSDNCIIQSIKEVDDLDAYTDQIKVFPSVGISRGAGELIEYAEDNRGVRYVHCNLGIRVYTKSESSPEAARKVLDVTVWKVVQALLANTYLTFADFDPVEFLLDSNVAGISYGSKKFDKVSYEYATISYYTRRDILDPVSDEQFYDILYTMIHTSFTGGNVVVTETTE